MKLPSVFSFSDDLRKAVQDSVVDRMVEVITSDISLADSIVRHGLNGVESLSSRELMDEYMDWHGVYSLDENPDDHLLKRMFDEINSQKLEEELLK